jgi:flagellar biosynthesis protein FlhB
MAGERSEAPTPKKLRDSRRKGEVAKSQEIVSIGSLLLAVLGVRYLGPGMWDGLGAMMSGALAGSQSMELNASTTIDMGRSGFVDGLLVLLPLFSILVLASVALSVAQTGFILSGAKLKPNFKTLNPWGGAKRIFSPDGGVNLIKSLAKMGVVSIVVTLTIRAQMAEISTLGMLGPEEATGRVFSFAFDIALRSAAVLFLLSLADYAWQRRSFLKKQKMTKQEVRQEHKDVEGDPLIQAAIRQRRQSLMNRMIADVPNADVVVTNPTHVAVALRYDPVSMAAPVVLAKGERLIAERIKEVARKAGVPVLEEPPLARALLRSTEVGRPVPANLYRAVAEVLAWVYSLQEAARGSAPASRAVV